jgi:U4/U6.U5 tri-snRNP component SNU23
MSHTPNVPLAPKAVDHTFRRKWNKDEYDAKATALGVTGVHNAALAVDGAVEVKAVTYEQDRGTATARTTSLNLDQNVGVRVEVADARTAGFYCAVCDRAEKDSASWLDHLNSVQHQKNAGTSLRAERSTVDEVHARLRELKRKALHSLAHGDDATPDAAALIDETEFEARLERLRQTDEERLAEKRARKRAKKKAAKKAAAKSSSTDATTADAAANDDDDEGDDVENDNDEQEPSEAPPVDDEAAAMAAMLGLPTGFSSKRK